MRQYWSHIEYTLRHKKYVFDKTLEFGIPINGLLHDISKFGPVELPAYSNHFFYPNGTRRPVDKRANKATDTKFKKSWAHHVAKNPHHWEHWVYGGVAVEMPIQYVYEMIADWYGAGKAQGTSDMKQWYNANKHRIILHPRTRLIVEKIINNVKP